GPTDALLQLFVDQTFLRTSAGDILRDLAGRARLSVSRAENGLRFSAYVVDGRRAAYFHLRDLADLCGFDLYAGSDGSIVVGPPSGQGARHTLVFARGVLAAALRETTPAAEMLEVYGESPASSRGEATWSWLTPDPRLTRGVAGLGRRRLLE